MTPDLESLCYLTRREGHSDLSRSFNTLRPRQNGRHFADDIFKCIFVNENVWIPIKISLKFSPNGPINNILALVQIMAWRRAGDKPLSEPMMVSLPTHICVTRPQRVKVELVESAYVDLNQMIPFYITRSRIYRIYQNIFSSQTKNIAAIATLHSHSLILVL